jgi:hypothetical protein
MMLSSPSSPVVAGTQAVLVAAFFVALGWLVADALFGRRRALGTEWGLSLAGLGVYALALMIVHMASDGRLFSNEWLTRVITLGTFTLLLLRKLAAWRSKTVAPTIDAAAWLAVALVLVAMVVWGTPVFRMLPLPSGGDISLHAPWASQLMNGEPTPAAAITGPIPNYYPWMFHVVLALVSRLTPGGRAIHGLAPLQLVLLACAVLTLFDLGRVIGRRTSAGASAALLGALAGGFGFVLLRGIDLVTQPRIEPLRYMGDLLYKRSYNASFLNLVPPFPRDLSFLLMLGALLLFVLAQRERSIGRMIWCGVVLGCSGLAGAESFVVGTGTMVAMAVVGGPLPRARQAAATLLPALAVYSLWLVPQVLDYLRLGGYLNLTVVGLVALPPAAILVSWGLVTPLSVLGAVRWGPLVRHDDAVRLVVALTVVAGACVVASGLVPRLFGDAFSALGKAHRYWPLLFCGLALVAALGASDLIEWARRAHAAAGIALFAAMVVLAIPSPVAASLAVPRSTGTGEGLFPPAARGDPRAALNLIAPAVGGRCVIATPLWVDTPVWTYTGYRMVMYTWSIEHPGNLARIRWADIYEHTTPERKRMHDNRILVRAFATPRQWREVARRYDVDVVLVPRHRADAPALTGYPKLNGSDPRFSVVRLTSCGT